MAKHAVISRRCCASSSWCACDLPAVCSWRASKQHPQQRRVEAGGLGEICTGSPAGLLENELPAAGPFLALPLWMLCRCSCHLVGTLEPRDGSPPPFWLAIVNPLCPVSDPGGYGYLLFALRTLHSFILRARDAEKIAGARAVFACHV